MMARPYSRYLISWCLFVLARSCPVILYCNIFSAFDLHVMVVTFEVQVGLEMHVHRCLRLQVDCELQVE